MAITKKTIKASSRMPRRSARPIMAARSMRRPVARPVASARPRSINAGTSVTASARARRASAPVMANVKLSDSQRIFASQLMRNYKKSQSIMGATNTSNIMAKPEFTQLLPLFVQKLLIPEVMGTVAMNSRQQLIPYFKLIAEGTKGETAKGDILNSPFVNQQGVDPNFTGRVIRNEAVNASTLAFTPVLPGSVSISDGTDKYYDDGAGNLIKASDDSNAGTIDYALGTIGTLTGDLSASYEYDNETVGPDQNGAYGAKMGKTYFDLDEINLVASAHELACYWSVYSAFAASNEWGANIEAMSKEAAIGELVAEINSLGFKALTDAAAYKPQFNWDASPILNGAVNPQGFLNMFKLKLEQASNSIYQATRIIKGNKLIVGTSAAAFIKMIDGFQSAGTSDNVGPFKLGKLDEYDIFVDPNLDSNKWVMTCKDDQDFRRTAALYGEYLPIGSTDAIGLADLSVQQGYYSMYDLRIINPDLIVSGKILGSF